MDPNELNDEELRLLQAIEALGGPVQGNEPELLERLDRKVAAVYRVTSALRDLEAKGFVASEPTVHVDREGRPKRAYALTPAGEAAFQAAPPAPPPRRARRPASLVLGSPEELAPRPVAPSWWRRALRKVIPGAALREELYKSVSEVDPAMVHAVHAAAAGKPTFNEALTAALQTAFQVTDPDAAAALPAGGSGGSDAGSVEYAKVPLRDLMALQEQLQRRDETIAELRATLADMPPHEPTAQHSVLVSERVVPGSAVTAFGAYELAIDRAQRNPEQWMPIQEARKVLLTTLGELDKENEGLAKEGTKLIASLGEYIRQSMTANPEWRGGILEMEAILLQRRRRVFCPRCGHKKHGIDECGAPDGTAEPGHCLCLGAAS